MRVLVLLVCVASLFASACGAPVVGDSEREDTLPANTPPTITPIADQTLTEGSVAGPLSFTVADVDTPLAEVRVTVSSSDEGLLPNANVVLEGGPGDYTLTLTPVPGGTGTTTITVRAEDEASATTVTFVLTVLPVNSAPTISDIADLTTDEDVATGPVPFTIFDVESLDTLVVTATSSDTSIVPVGNVTIVCASGDCTFDILPAQDMNGVVTITFTVSDGEDSAQTSFVLTVLPVDDPPFVSAIDDQIIEVNTTTGSLAFTVQAIDQDDDEDDFIITAVSSNPTVIPNTPAHVILGGSGMSRTIEIVPATNQVTTTPATITLTVTDDDGLSTVVAFTVTVTVAPVNDPPEITQVPDQMGALRMFEDTARSVTFDVSDADASDTLTVSAISGNTTILPSENLVFDAVSGFGRTVLLTLTPALDQNGGPFTITVSVSDGAVSVPMTFEVFVEPVNDAPVAVNDAFTTQANQHFSGELVGPGAPGVDIDVDGDVLGAVPSVVEGATGRFEVFADGSFEYIPAGGFTGVAVFTYQVIDPGGLTDTGTVTITVVGPIVWYVNSLNGSAGTGTDQDPFQTLAQAEAASGEGDTIVVECASGGSTYAGGIALKHGQVLLGASNGVLGAGNGCTRPRITGSPAIELAGGNTVSNFTIAGATVAAVLGDGVGGATALGGLSITGSPGIEIVGSVASATLSLEDIDVAMGTGFGLRLVDAGTVTGTGTFAVEMVTGRPLELVGLTLEEEGLVFSSVSTEASSSGASVHLAALEGSVSIARLDLTQASADGLVVDDVTSLTVSDGTLSVAGPSARAIALTGSAFDIELESVTSSGSPTVPTVSLATTEASSFTVRGSGAPSSGGEVRGGLHFSGPIEIGLSHMASRNSAQTALSVAQAPSLAVEDCVFEASGGEAALALTDVEDVMLDTIVIAAPSGSGIALSTSVDMSALELRDVEIGLAPGNAHDCLAITVASTGSLGAGYASGFECVADDAGGGVWGMGAGIRLTASGSLDLELADVLVDRMNHALVARQDLDAVVSVRVLGTSVFERSFDTAVLLQTATSSTATGSLTLASQTLQIGWLGAPFSGSFSGYGIDLQASGSARARLDLAAPDVSPGAAFRSLSTRAGGIRARTAGSGPVALVMNAGLVRTSGIATHALELHAQQGTLCTDVRRSQLASADTSDVYVRVEVASSGGLTVPSFIPLMGETPSATLWRVMTDVLLNAMGGSSANASVTGAGTIANAASCP